MSNTLAIVPYAERAVPAQPPRPRARAELRIHEEALDRPGGVLHAREAPPALPSQRGPRKCLLLLLEDVLAFVSRLGECFGRLENVFNY